MISSVENFDLLVNLSELILDKNGLEEIPPFPVMKSLETLWLNNNKINDLPKAVASISKSVMIIIIMIFIYTFLTRLK